MHFCFDAGKVCFRNINSGMCMCIAVTVALY